MWGAAAEGGGKRDDRKGHPCAGMGRICGIMVFDTPYPDQLVRAAAYSMGSIRKRVKKLTNSLVEA